MHAPYINPCFEPYTDRHKQSVDPYITPLTHPYNNNNTNNKTLFKYIIINNNNNNKSNCNCMDCLYINTIYGIYNK